jgi:uncharacterized GH25 family protein
MARGVATIPAPCDREGVGSPHRPPSPPRTMTRRIAASLAALVLLCATTLAAHDLFLKPASYFVRPHGDVQVSVLNGTFTTSENAITRDRILDVSLVGPDGRQRIDTARWTDAGTKSVISLRVGAPGTYVVGASLKPRELSLAGAEFTAYLTEEGIDEVVAARTHAGTAADSARERYSKHVKALLQVGDAGSNDYQAVLGYPAEIVPLDNPYTARLGGTVRVRCLVDGKPAAGVTVLVGGRTPGGERFAVQRAVADADGAARVRLDARGQYYVKFIRMAEVPGGSVDYESKWATLTFAVR